MDAKRAEVLAPAGDKTAFEAALAAGADAVYLGLQDFSARKSAANFTVDDLAEAARKAHALGAKVYVALNTLVKEGERENFFVSALQAWNAGADALIVQELFLGRELKRLYPEMELHLSTQAGVCNAEGARLAKEYGFSRVILARETPLSDIARIAAIVETECFVQGALCTCFSGQCYFSSVVGGNSGNRGLCKQPCRKRYSIDRAGFEKPAYRLSLADLCVGEDIEKLLQAGVSSFKIEGRMRSAAYVGAAVRYYRDILDGTGDRAQDLSDLKRTFNRGNYTKGYLFGQDKNLLSPAIQGHIGEAVGKVEGKDKSGRYLFVRSTFVPQDKDGFKVVRGGAEEVGGALWRSGYPAAKGGFYIPFDAKYRRGDDVCLTLDNALAARIEKRRRAAEVRLSITMRAGEPLRVAARGKFRPYIAETQCGYHYSRAVQFVCHRAREHIDCALRHGIHGAEGHGHEGGGGADAHYFAPLFHVGERGARAGDDSVEVGVDYRSQRFFVDEFDCARLTVARIVEQDVYAAIFGGDFAENARDRRGVVDIASKRIFAVVGRTAGEHNHIRAALSERVGEPFAYSACAARNDNRFPCEIIHNRRYYNTFPRGWQRRTVFRRPSSASRRVGICRPRRPLRRKGLRAAVRYL